MLPLWLCIPFAGLLLCIAIMPLVKAEWWESHQIHAVIFWSLLFIIPYAVTKGASTAAETVLECIINDYLSFIILLFGLFCVTRAPQTLNSPVSISASDSNFFKPNSRTFSPSTSINAVPAVPRRESWANK